MSSTDNGHKHEVDLEEGQALSGHRPVSIMLTPDQFKAFEKAYLDPGAAATRNAQRRSLGNPTALGIASLLLTLMPLAVNLLGWGPNSPAGNLTLVGSLIFISGIGLEIAGLLEFVLGNSFIFLVFCTLGGFTLALGATLDPQFLIVQTLTTAPPGTPAAAAAAAAAAGLTAYQSGLAIFLISWGVFCFLFLCMSIFINVIFFIVFGCLTMVCFTWAASLYTTIAGNLDRASTLLTVAGSFAFVATVLGWYLLTHLILVSVGANGLPVGDFSGYWSKKAERAKAAKALDKKA